MTSLSNAFRSAMGRIRLLLLFILVLAVVVEAQQKPVNVNRDSSGIKITVRSAASLSELLSELCKSTASDCEGVDGMPALVVAPLEMSGSWNEVLSKLMEGSGINYVAEPPGKEKRGRLLIRGSVPSSRPEPTLMQSQPFVTQTPPAAEPTPPPSVIEGPAPEERTEISSPDTVARPSSSFGMSHASTFSGSGEGYLPFPDARGNAIPAKDEPAQYLPFPDARGNPIPVKNESPQYLPFPDSRGRPIPVKNEPQQYLPFPDSKGNPIPVTAPK